MIWMAFLASRVRPCDMQPMRRRRGWAVLSGAIVAITAVAARHGWPPSASATAEAAASGGIGPPVRPETAPVHPDPPPSRAPPAVAPDLTRIVIDETGAVAPAGAGTVRLTLDPDLQRTAVGLMAGRHLLEAAIVVMDPKSGHLLVYASYLDRGPARDLCSRATAPSASVFKIVTAAALVEEAHLSPDTTQCYAGGEQRIDPVDLVENARRDRWCTTLAGALGRSVNAVFARLAQQHLLPQQLDAMARRFGYGQELPFDVPVQPSAVRLAADPLEFARMAAGFRNTTLSPLQAVEISATVARGGDRVRPSIVESTGPDGAEKDDLGDPPRRAIAPETAAKLASMMTHTVTEGTSRRAFHDPRGAPYLPGIGVAGKTGTLADADSQRQYTWFTGFAPTTPIASAPQVAIAVLAVNGPAWTVKANVLAREVLRAYFAARGVRGVTRPPVVAVGRRGYSR
jgi:penicillin-binding protein A